MSHEMDCLENQAEILEVSVEEMAGEKKEIEKRERRLNKAIANLEHDADICKQLEKRKEYVAKDDKKWEKKFEACQKEYESIQENLRVEAERLSRSREVVQELNAMGENVSDMEGILANREEHQIQCINKLEQIAQSLHIGEHSAYSDSVRKRSDFLESIKFKSDGKKKEWSSSGGGNAGGDYSVRQRVIYRDEKEHDES